MNGRTIEGRERIRLVVPALVTRPSLGVGCCVVLAADLVCDSVAQVHGVHDVACDDERGEVWIEFDAGSPVLPSVRAVLDGLGYPAAGIEA